MLLPDRTRSRPVTARIDPADTQISREAHGRLARHAAMLATVGLGGVIALAPLPFGSMDARIIAVWVLMLCGVLLLASLEALSARDLFFLSGFAFVSAGWAIVVALQLIPALLPSDQLRAPVWRQASTLLGETLTGSASTARNQAFFSAGSQIACLLSMLCGYLIGRNHRSARFLLAAFLISALTYAIEGLVGFVLWPNFTLWQQKYNYLNSLTGTFINPNVAATYFGAAMIGCFLVAADTWHDRSTGPLLPWRELVRLRLHEVSPRKMSYPIACFVLLTTTMLTGSRAGTVLALLALSGALATRFRKALRQRKLFWVVPAATIPLAIVAVMLLSPRANLRFGVQGFFDLGRWYTYASTLRIIEDYPWLGSGLGTFKWVFPAYRSGEIPSYGIWEQSHNTILEIAAEMGLPFALLVAAGWIAILAVLCRGMLSRNRDATLPTAAFWIGLLAAIHSQLDFPLQIPGLSLAVCPILGMGLAQSFSRRSSLLTS